MKRQPPVLAASARSRTVSEGEQQQGVDNNGAPY